MFNLEQSIAEWRKQMLAAGIEIPALAELESHLREEIERQIDLGLGCQQAFGLAVREIGEAKKIKMEFMKMEHWNRRLAWTALGLFVASFFMPACNDARGWQCAWISASAAIYNWHNLSLGTIWLASLTLANLLTVVSPLLLYSKIGPSKWLRWLFVGAGILVWSYIVGLMATGALHQLKIGCYAWGLSYLLFCFSMFTARNPKTLLTANV